MTVERETYAELLHSMTFAFASGQLSMPQIASVMFACAQPTTTEEVTDLTHDVREKLTDWPEQDKGMLIAIEMVVMTFQCVNIHGPCKKGKHSVNMTRVIGSMDWEPENVTSQLDFSDVILSCMHVPADGRLVSHRKGTVGDLIGVFRDMFMEPPEQKMEKEIDEFRAELDKLFPSTPHEKGGSDGS